MPILALEIAFRGCIVRDGTTQSQMVAIPIDLVPYEVAHELGERLAPSAAYHRIIPEDLC